MKELDKILNDDAKAWLLEELPKKLSGHMLSMRVILDTA
jgi:hypothetical protein